MSRTSTGQDRKNLLLIKLLGGFSVLVDGIPIPDTEWKSRRVRSLIKLLALAPGHRLHRDQVMDALWPDSNLSAAANNLHQALFTARRLLDHAQAGNLVLEDGFLGLVGRADQALVVDVEQFEEAVSKADISQDPEKFRAALALYPGDLLPEDLYEEWTLQRRQNLRLACTKLLLSLARLEEALHHFPASIDLLNRLVDMDRCHEEAHAGLMRLYALSGQRQLALRQYQTFRQVLQADLEAEPGQITHQLFQDIQSGQYAPVAPLVSQPSAVLAYHHLPATISSFIGRAPELTKIRQMLGQHRLVTLTGAGGIGKTRLALQVARGQMENFADGIFFVDLSPVTDPGQVGPAVASALGIRDTMATEIEELLIGYLNSRAILLVMDNCEHLILACAHLLAHLLNSCPNLSVLATSREPLGIEGEAIYPLLTLAFPTKQPLPGVDILKGYDAVRLFVERAVLVNPGFALNPENAQAVILICRRLDGLPLALELAAARANQLSVEQIASRLDNCFRLLVGSRKVAPARHETMKNVLDWSHDLLSEAEKVLLRRLAVFMGGWTLDAAEAVCSASGSLAMESILDLLGQLVNKSLVVAMTPWDHSGQEMRYFLLEPVRQYALEKLEQAGETETLRGCHLAYFLNLADQTSKKPFRNQWPRQWKLLKNDIENLRSGLHFALSGISADRAETGLRLACSLYDFWMQSSLFIEGHAWLNKALALNTERVAQDKGLRAWVYQVIGALAAYNPGNSDANRLLNESVALYREIGDDWRLAQALAELALNPPTIFTEDSQAVIDEAVALARQVGDVIVLSFALVAKGFIEEILDKPENSFNSQQESLKLLMGIGARGATCFPMLHLGALALNQRNFEAALNYREDFLRDLTEIEDRSLNYWSISFLTITAIYLGDYQQVADLAQSLLDQSQGQNIIGTLVALRYSGIALKHLGKYRRAAACYYESLCLSQKEEDFQGIYMDINGLAGIISIQGQPERAVRLFGAVEALLEMQQSSLDLIGQHEAGIEIDLIRGLLTEEAFSRAWAEGRKMSADEILSEAREIAEELSKLISS